MISFLDYIKHTASFANGCGVIFTGRLSNVATRFPSGVGAGGTNQRQYYYYSKDITDMSEYGFFGFYNNDDQAEEIQYNGQPYYKRKIYNNIETKEAIGYFLQHNTVNAKQHILQIGGVDYTDAGSQYTPSLYEFKNGTTYYTRMPRGETINTTYQFGMFDVQYEVLKKQTNFSVVLNDRGWHSNDTSNAKVVAYLDFENKKVMWAPQSYGGEWEDFSKYYKFGTEEKVITKYLFSNFQYDIFIDREDEDFNNFQTITSSGKTWQIIVLDEDMYANKGYTPIPPLFTYDVPQKLIEKYSNRYACQIIRNDGARTGELSFTDAIIFNFKVPLSDGFYEDVYVIYHPSTKNWCEIWRGGETYGTGYNACIFEDLTTDQHIINLNWIDQSSIDLDIYKKMGEIGNGLMLFDDETEDLKYLYDTKNKELYNEYCDLVGTNAITFKK